MRKIFSSVMVSLLATGSVFSAVLAPVSVHAATVNTAIKGSSSTVYWYASNGNRYVFPNANTYFTWFPTMATVQTVSDTEFSGMPLAGSVTYRPGAKLVKIESDPKVYAVARYGVLRHVTTESLAASLYGSNWQSQIHDIPAVFFSNYTVGAPIYNTYDFNVSQEYNGVSTPSDNISVSISTSNDGSLNQTRFWMRANPTHINTNQSVTLTAYSAIAPSGSRIELVDRRAGTTLNTCWNALTCQTAVNPQVVADDPEREYEARLIDQNGTRLFTDYAVVAFGAYGAGPIYRSVAHLTADPSSVVGTGNVLLTAKVSHVRRGTLINNTLRSNVRIKDENGAVIQTCTSIGENAPCTISRSVTLVSGASTIFRAEADSVDYPASIVIPTSASVTNSATGSSNGDARITGLTLTSSHTSINSGETIRLTANATNSGAWSYVGNRIEIRDQRNGNIVRTCNDQSWCAPDVIVYRLNNETTVQYEARIYDRNGVLAMTSYSPVINLSGTSSGSGSTNTGSGSITGISLTSSHSSINAGETIRLTANATNVGGYSYSGNRIEIVDTRNGSIVRTCNDRSWCAPDITVNRIGSENSVQFYAVIRNSAGTELARGYSPVINLSGNASGQLSGSVDVYFAPKPAQPSSSVYVTASVTNVNYPTSNLTIRVFDGISSNQIGSCTGVVVCSVQYAIGATVPNAFFTATVSTQDPNNKIQSPTVSLR